MRFVGMLCRDALTGYEAVCSSRILWRGALASLENALAGCAGAGGCSGWLSGFSTKRGVLWRGAALAGSGKMLCRGALASQASKRPARGQQDVHLH